MIGIKEEADLTMTATERETVEPDEATRQAFGDLEVDPTPATAPAPFFKIDECITYKICAARGLIKSLGAIVRTVAWNNDSSSYVYKLAEPETAAVLPSFYFEEELETSAYGVGDIVKINAFGKSSNLSIKKVHFDAAGFFTYEVGAGLRARSEDVVCIVARRR